MAPEAELVHPSPARVTEHWRRHSVSVSRSVAFEFEKRDGTRRAIMPQVPRSLGFEQNHETAKKRMNEHV